MLRGLVSNLGLGVLFLSLVLLGTCDSAVSAPSEDSEQCLALVEYSAITGDPNKANKSTIFRGFTRVIILTEGDAVGNSTLSWTFSEGEHIQTGRDVFRDSPETPVRDGAVEFVSNTVQDSQTVTLDFSHGDGPVDIGFVASKGKVSVGSAPEQYIVGLPEMMTLNGLECSPVTEALDPNYESAQDDGQVPSEKIVDLHYLPIEFTNMRFYKGYASRFAIFTFRLKNVGSRPINLTDLTIEYWFDGGNAQEKSPETMFQSHCMTTSPNIDCSKFNVAVLPGLERVSGAHYKTQIGFTADAGVLTPEPGFGIGNFESLGSDQEGPPTHIVEAIMNVTSVQFFAQIDVTKDYSFMNTTILEGNALPEQLVSRKYEENVRMPVLYKGKIVFGRRPRQSQKTVTPTANPSTCWFKKPGVSQCGLRAKYCCLPPKAPIPNPRSVVPPALPGTDLPPEDGRPGWVAMVIVVCIGLLVACCCICLLFRWYGRRQWKHGKLPTGNDNMLDTGEFGSHAWSIYDADNSGKVKPHIQESEEEDNVPDIRRSGTKFHTVPSISGVNSCLLIDMKDRQGMIWDPREEKTWTGHIHWLWEPWNAAEVRRTATTLAPTKSGPQFFTMSTKKLPNIDVKVDFVTEIEPFIGEQLGEGGFGKVYKAKFRGTDVAVKVLKVDTQAMIQSLEDEIKLSSKMHSDRVVRLLGACLGNKDNVCLVMELVEGGNLSKRIHNKSLRRLEYIEVLHIGLDIVEGLAYLHPTVIHRDLKPQNVLLDRNGRAKIADFGISKFKDPHKSYLSVTQTGGTPNYMAPELFNGTRVDEKCDIYSLGCILYEAMSRRVPLSDLPGENCQPLFQIIKTVAIDKRRPKIPDNFPSDLADLIRACWKDNPKSRPSSSDVVRELGRMIDEEVARIQVLRQQAQRKDSGASSSQSMGRRSPMLDLFNRIDRREALSPTDGRRSIEPSLSRASSREPSGRRHAAVGRPVVNGKIKRKKSTAEKVPDVESFHSAKSSEFFSVESTNLRAAADARARQSVEALCSNPAFGPNRASIYMDEAAMAKGVSARAAVFRGSAPEHDMRLRSRYGSHSYKSSQSEYVPEPVMSPHTDATPPDRLLNDPYGFDPVSGELEGSAQSQTVRRKASNSRYQDLRGLQLDGSFAVELMNMKNVSTEKS